MRRITTAAIVVLGLTTLACSQQAEAPAAGAQGAQQAATPEPAVAGSAAAANLRNLEGGAGTIFQASCAGCHGGDPKPGKFSLDPTALVETTVGMPCAQIDTLALIEPGRPDRSYIIMKVVGDPRIKGKRMPIGAEPLAADRIKALTDWVVALAAAPADSAGPAESAAPAAPAAETGR